MTKTPHKTHGEAQIIDFPHISLMRAKGVQAIKEDLACICCPIIKAL